MEAFKLTVQDCFGHCFQTVMFFTDIVEVVRVVPAMYSKAIFEYQGQVMKVQDGGFVLLWSRNQYQNQK